MKNKKYQDRKMKKFINSCAPKRYRKGAVGRVTEEFQEKMVGDRD